MAVDPRTPVLVGVGQFTERIDDPSYRGMSAVELATAAAQAALTDTGVDAAAVAQAIEVFVGLRQFEICTPFAKPPLGCSDNYLRSVAQRVGRRPGARGARAHRRQRPAEAGDRVRGRAIAAGDIEVALIVGSEPGSTAKYFATRDDKPDFTEHVGGQLEDRGYGFEQYMSEYTATARTDRRARAVRTAGQRAPCPTGPQRRRLPPTDGRALRAVLESRCQEPVFVVAGGAFGGRDHDGHRREPDDLRPVSPVDGRPRSGESGCGGAADVGGRGAPTRRGRGEVGVPAWARRSDRAGPVGPRRRRHQLLGETGCGEKRFGSPASASTTSRPSISTAASRSRFSRCATSSGSTNDDPRGFTLTGGLPYFGGPGNSYSLHGIAETVAEMRDKPGTFGLVGANGGIMSKYSVGIYSTEARRLGGRPQQGAAAGHRGAAEGRGHPQRQRSRRPSRRTRCATTGRSRRASSSAGSMPTTAGSWPSPKTTTWWR